MRSPVAIVRHLCRICRVRCPSRRSPACEQVGAAHGRWRVLGHNAVELVGLARVLARNAVEERRQRLVRRVPDGGDQNRLMERAHAVAGPHAWLAAGREFAPHHLALRREPPSACHVLGLPGRHGPTAGPQEQQAIAAGEQADRQCLDGVEAHDAVVRIGPLRGPGGTVVLKVPRRICHDDVIGQRREFAKGPGAHARPTSHPTLLGSVASPPHLQLGPPSCRSA